MFFPEVLNPAKDGEEGEVVVKEGDEGAQSNSNQSHTKQVLCFYEIKS
jgi:hypothetical protein